MLLSLFLGFGVSLPFMVCKNEYALRFPTGCVDCFILPCHDIYEQ
jgi:hypothetical protein